MVLIRAIGWALVILALIIIADDIRLILSEQRRSLTPLGEIWSYRSLTSLNLLQTGIERYVHPWLWDPVLLNIILWPAGVTLGVTGIVILLIFRKKRKHRVFAHH